MIQLSEVTKSYSGVKAVDTVTLSIPSGQILGFLGPNGAGKTTTMRMITCYMPPTSGKITVDGLDTLDQSLEVRRKIGYLPEMAPVYQDINVVDYLNYVCDLRKIDKDKRPKRIKEIVGRCGLEDVLSKDVGQLSKGYRQRVGLAQAMMHDPDILVLDEPTAGLDPNQIAEIRMLIKELGREKTVILSTHILSEVQATCSRIVIINQGRIVADDTPEGLQAGVAGHSVVLTTVKTGAADVVAKARTVLGVEDVRMVPSVPGTHRLRIESPTDRDIREDFFKLAVRENWVMLEMTQEARSLEDVFHKLTLEDN
ncbi:ATP-binding cassette domain-containing protein [candidate division KSB1 bacterium]|nr:MAG: ATP-binding cassette domain-containing protein [candidate division KSB1 bacterium]